MAWTTTTGSVYAMPLENWGTWQQVKGISAVGVTGLSRFFLFGQDLSGKPYHWNVNAPFFSATFGGQWNAGLGCPDPAHPCNSSATHTLSHNMVFKTGHGIGGGLKQKTDLFTHDIEVPNLVTNPSCDPFFGQQADPECVAEIGTTAFCNESHADVEQTMEFWVSGVSVDDEAWAGNAGHNGPYAVFVLAPSVGTWEGDVTSAPLENVCPIGNDWLGNPSGLPTCQASAVYEDWFCPFFNADENPDCLYLVNRAMGEAENGVTSPWVLTDTYRQQVDANGNPVGAPVCANAGSGYSPKEKWFGSMFFLPACQ